MGPSNLGPLGPLGKLGSESKLAPGAQKRVMLATQYVWQYVGPILVPKCLASSTTRVHGCTLVEKMPHEKGRQGLCLRSSSNNNNRQQSQRRLRLRRQVQLRYRLMKIVEADCNNVLVTGLVKSLHFILLKFLVIKVTCV